MKVIVSDAGPLIALAKLDVLKFTLRLYPTMWISEATYREAVTMGLDLNAPDALVIDQLCTQKKIEVHPVPSSAPKWHPSIGLQKGEMETIRLALTSTASTVLIDDRDARIEAHKAFAYHGLVTEIKGTLGVLVTMYQKGIIAGSFLKHSIESIIRRKDIWISPKLCLRLLAALEKGNLK